jgi:hypothetical protein
MSEGNGADLGHIAVMLRQVIVAQDGQGRRLDGLTAEVASGFRELRTAVGELRSDVRGLRSEVSGLRQAVVEYHSAVIGHGILISELEARMRRIEQHLNLPPTV